MRRSASARQAATGVGQPRYAEQVENDHLGRPGTNASGDGMGIRCSAAIAAIVLASAHGSGAAQQQPSDDWDVRIDPARQVATASAAYDSGLSLAIQCRGGALAIGIDGLPPTTAPYRSLERLHSDGRRQHTVWTVTAAGTAVFTQDARMARSFRAGGALTLVSSDNEPAPVRIELDLPSGTSGIDRVLSACGRRLEDPRDHWLSAQDFLLEVPRVEIAGYGDRSSAVQVELSCRIANSRLSECQADHETPRDADVGAATARKANGTRVRLRDPAAAEGRVLDILVTGAFTRR